jgi:hypothetical protein
VKKARYEIDAPPNGTWTVYEIETGLPVEVDGAPQIGLDVRKAEELAERLNRQADEALKS